MNKQVNFTTVMDYRQTFTVNLDFEEVQKDLMENADFDDEEVQGTWDEDDYLYEYAWDLVMKNPDKYRDQA